MSFYCGCGTALGNFGAPDCVTVISETSRIIIGRAWKSDGTRNYIDTGTLTSAAFYDRFNRWTAAGALVSDDNKLWITPKLHNVTDERGESKTWTSEAGAIVKTGEGTKSFTGHLIGKDAPMEVLHEARKFDCTELCYWKIDDLGSVVGERLASGTSTYLYGILMEPGSWDPQWIEPKPNVPNMIQFKFSVERYEQDADLKVLPANRFTANFNLNNVKPNYNLYGTKVSASQTVIVIDIYAGTADGKGYNDMHTGQPWKGGVTADFKVWNDTDATELTPSGVTESSVVPGRYSITVASQTVSDDMRVRVKKNRVDSYHLEQVPCVAV